MHYYRYTCRTFLGLRVCVAEMSQISVDARVVNLHDRQKRFFFVYKWWYYLLKNMLSNWNKRPLFYTSLYSSVHGSTHTYKLKLQPYPKLISNPPHLVSLFQLYSGSRLVWPNEPCIRRGVRVRWRYSAKEHGWTPTPPHHTSVAQRTVHRALECTWTPFGEGIRLNNPYAAAMRPYVKSPCPLVCLYSWWTANVRVSRH